MTEHDPRSWRRRLDVPGAPAGLIVGAFRLFARVASGIYSALGLLILAGAAIAFIAAWAFAELAEHVQAGTIQPVDDAVLRWVSGYRAEWLEASLMEVSVLGSWVVVVVVATVAALFLSLSRRRWSVIFLIVTTIGGIIINQLLKAGFARPRPQIFEWGDHVVTSSFPSGHATSAAITYGTIAYLIARLHERAITRRAILAAAAVLILLVSTSRVYLGVHYLSDVIAGLLVGLAWAAFCMAVLEALQRFMSHPEPREESQLTAEHSPIEGAAKVDGDAGGRRGPARRRD